MLAFLKKISAKLSIVKINRTQFLGLFSFVLHFKDGETLKVDFNYYPFTRIEKGLKYKNLEVDSIYDIAVNKVHTLFTKPRVRDYIDLYFIMKKFEYSLNKLVLDAKAKFDWHIDPVTLGSQFLRVKSFNQSDFPKMLIPFNKKDMEVFFLKLAKSLEGDIFN